MSPMCRFILASDKQRPREIGGRSVQIVAAHNPASFARARCVTKADDLPLIIAIDQGESDGARPWE